MLVQTGSVGSRRDSATGETQFNDYAAGTCSALDQLYEEPLENDLPECIITEELIPVRRFGITSIERPQHYAARVEIALAFDYAQHVLLTFIPDDI